jgi:glycerol-3-phosphate acyltransferase PlsY
MLSHLTRIKNGYTMVYLLIIAAYLLGSISTAIITCKLLGLPDPRTVGSNNPGATNVLRYGGKKAAGVTLLGDLLKGLIPVLAGQALGLDYTGLILIGIAAFLGHLYPLYYGFKGGKGVATAIGVFLGVNFWGGLAFVATWLLMAKGFKISSLAALIATALSPLYFWLITGHGGLTLGVTVMALLIFWRHQSNIRKLLSGEEDKIQARED